MEDTAVVAAFQTRHAFVLAEVERIVRQAWGALAAYNDAQVAEFAAQIEAVLPAAQQTVAASVDAMVSIMTGMPPVGVPNELVTNVRGLTAVDEYRRPFIQLWGGLAEGGEYQPLVQQAADRAVKMALTDTQMAMRNAMDHVADHNPHVTGYRRTLTGKSCMFCAAAATRVYHRKHLMPLHSHCDCGIAPIIGHRDPGKVANHELLSNLKAQGPEYWKQRGFVGPDGLPIDPTAAGDLPVTVLHGEIGPILATT